MKNCFKCPRGTTNLSSLLNTHKCHIVSKFKLQLAFERQNGRLFQMSKETTNAFNKM
jgi:hypothetical protein